MIYLIGFFLSYILTKYNLKKYMDDSWIRVIVCFFCGLVSWYGVIGNVIYLIINGWKPKPPKFL